MSLFWRDLAVLAHFSLNGTIWQNLAAITAISNAAWRCITHVLCHTVRTVLSFIPSLISRLTYSLKPIFVMLSSYSPASSVLKVSTHYQPMLIYQSAPRTSFPLISPYDFSSKRIPVWSSLCLDIVTH